MDYTCLCILQNSAISALALAGLEIKLIGIGKGGSGGVKAVKVNWVGVGRGGYLITFEELD